MITYCHILLLAISILISQHIVQAQFIKTNGPYGGWITSYITTDSNLFAGTIDGVFRSTDGGSNWLHTGLTGCWVTSLAAAPGTPGGWNILAGTMVYGVFLSSDNGTSWTKIDTGLSSNDCFDCTSDSGGVITKEKFCSLTVTTLAVSQSGVNKTGSSIFVGISKTGIFRSTDNGTSWTAVYNVPPNPEIRSLTVNSGSKKATDIFAGTSDGIFHSFNNGTSWTPIGLKGFSICDIAVCQDDSGVTNIFANTDNNNVYISTNNGSSWTNISPPRQHGFCVILPRTLPLALYRAKEGQINLYTVTDDGLFRSSDKGKTWIAINNGLTESSIYALEVFPDEADGTHLLAGTRGPGVFLSTNDGSSWFVSNKGLTNTDICDLAVNPLSDGNGGSILIAGTENSGIFLTTNNGSTWTAINKGLAFAQAENLVICPDKDGNPDFFVASKSGLFISTNNGSNWSTTSLKPSGIVFVGVSYSEAREPYLYSGNYMHDMFLSKDHGVTWETINNGITNNYFRSFGTISKADGNSIVFVGTDHANVFCSSDNGNNWTDVTTNVKIGAVRAFAAVRDEIGNYKLFVGSNVGVFLSTDDGTSWTKTGLTDTYVRALAVCYNKSGSANLFAGTHNGSILLSTNNGLGWTTLKSGTKENSVRSLIVSGTNLFVGCYNSCVLRYSLKDILK
jgi:photosystem II stability/assembly factor-like uncharacterized protein